MFRTGVNDVNLATAATRNIQADRVKPGAPGKTAPLADADIDRWIVAATEFADERDKAGANLRFAWLKPDFREAADEPTWSGLAETSRALDPDGAQSRRRLADRLGALACGPDGAPYVARALLENHSYRFAALGDKLDGVRNRMKAGREKPDACKGVAGFTEADWRALDAIEAR